MHVEKSLRRLIVPIPILDMRAVVWVQFYIIMYPLIVSFEAALDQAVPESEQA